MIPILMQLGHTAPHPLPPSTRAQRTNQHHTLAHLKASALECLACGSASQNELINWLSCNARTVKHVLAALVREGLARQVRRTGHGRPARAWELVEANHE